MKIYTVKLSEDGLMTKCATNVKALFNLVKLSGYDVTEINYYDRAINKHMTIKYNYNGLCYAIKMNTMNNKFYANIKLIGNGDSGSIEIKELEIISK